MPINTKIFLEKEEMIDRKTILDSMEITKEIETNQEMRDTIEHFFFFFFLNLRLHSQKTRVGIF